MHLMQKKTTTSNPFSGSKGLKKNSRRNKQSPKSNDPEKGMSLNLIVSISVNNRRLHVFLAFNCVKTKWILFVDSIQHPLSNYT